MNFEFGRTYPGDARVLIPSCPADTFSLVITSPPYFRQRAYTDSANEIGREKSIDEYVAELVAVFDECVRVTRPDGSIVFNLGDKYLDGCLKLVPYRFALAIRSAKLLNEVTWIKLNPTPKNQRRMVPSTEPFFHFVKGPNYKYYPERLVERANAKAGPNVGQSYFRLIEESGLSPTQKEMARAELVETIAEVKAGTLQGFRMKIRGLHAEAFGGQPGGRKTQMDVKGYTIIRMPGNGMLKDYVEFPVETVKGGRHPAVYPEGLVDRFVLLTTDEGDAVLDPFMGSASRCDERRGATRTTGR